MNGKFAKTAQNIMKTIVADYSLSQFKSVLEEIVYTIRIFQWGVPGETMQKAPVMETAAQRHPSSEGITSPFMIPIKLMIVI